MAANQLTPADDFPPGPKASGARPHLLHVFSSFEIGGQQMRFVKLARAWGQRYRHTVVAMDGRLDCLALLEPDLPVTPLQVKAAKGRTVSLANLRAFRRVLRWKRPDLLLTYNWGAVEWALANRWAPRCGTVHFEDGFGPEEAAGRQLSRRVWFRRAALGGHARIVVPSKTLHAIATRRWRLPADRVLHLPNGIDVEAFARPPGAAPFPLPDRGRRIVIGAVGKLRPEKNFARLLEAFAALPAEAGAHLVIVGDGPEREALEARAASLGIGTRVTFAGRVDRPETVYGLFDVFALSSDTEQMPLTVLEAMAAGLPVLATDVGDVAAMVSAENRPYIVPPEDGARYGAALAALAADAGLRRRLGGRNQAEARARFDERVMVEAYDRLLGGLLTA